MVETFNSGQEEILSTNHSQLQRINTKSSPYLIAVPVIHRHNPDFLLKTQSNKLVMVEAKGALSYLKGGAQWLQIVESAIAHEIITTQPPNYLVMVDMTSKQYKLLQEAQSRGWMEETYLSLPITLEKLTTLLTKPSLNALKDKRLYERLLTPRLEKQRLSLIQTELFPKWQVNLVRRLERLYIPYSFGNQLPEMWLEL